VIMCGFDPADRPPPGAADDVAEGTAAACREFDSLLSQAVTAPTIS